MFQSLHSRAGIGVGATGGLTLFLTLGIATPAAQANGAVSAQADAVSSAACPVQRIGTQLVRCDNLSGAGAAARPSVLLWEAPASLSSAPASLPSLPPRMNRGMF
ncbi:hypothetical protein ASC66_06545 [Leifsonia sp. Root4]|uniref:hypothetical protein n=1 Tax=Leifsonia sp. Root4 TaxID=1736525 RepID=UPI0006FF0A66|nr:hypothetical protein [Leifsonia sp. Root4]KQW06185.1 hypothetical protein ASC66_06545 [Leifsonia sp. Root4]